MEVEYDAVLKYLQLKQYPEGSTPKNKRSIRRKCENFVLRDGLLFHSSRGALRQWISSKEKQKQIMTSCHADSLGGHLGRDKTRHKIASR